MVKLVIVDFGAKMGMVCLQEVVIKDRFKIKNVGEKKERKEILLD